MLYRFLGTGKYNKCIYKFKGDLVETRFIQEAIISTVCRFWDWNKDIVSVFIPKKSKDANWFNGNDENRKLEEILRNKGVNFEEIQILEGQTERKLWKIYDEIFDVIDDEDNVVFDITHGLRSIPLQELVALNCAKVIKNISIAGIYYGAYEAREKVCNKVITPIFDLTPFNKLLDEIRLK